MKKKGFTLAEVLVALGIIGVVAAMTMPTFTASTQNAKIGPSLATAVSNFEQANAAMLSENGVESILDLNGNCVYSYRDINGNIRHETLNGPADTALRYLGVLSYNLKGGLDDIAKISNPRLNGESASHGTLTTKNGIAYTVTFTTDDARSAAIANYNGFKITPAMRYLGLVSIDINGTGTRPNTPGQDVFFFGLFADGSLRPVGGSNPWNNTDETTWQTTCNSTEVTNAVYCAGSIFENGLKVIYD